MSIVITGNPGVGKHTIAKKLATKLDLEIIDINKIAKGVTASKHSSGALNVDTEKLKPILKKLIKKNSLVVGHLAPYVLSKSQVKKVFVFRKNPYELERIYNTRKYSKEKRLENLGSEILGVIAFDAIKNFGKKKIIQITAESSVAKTFKKIEKSLDGIKVNEDVDWLSMVTEKGDLKKFFPY